MRYFAKIGIPILLARNIGTMVMQWKHILNFFNHYKLHKMTAMVRNENVFSWKNACRINQGIEGNSPNFAATAADLRRISRGIFYENKRRNGNRILWRFPPKRGQDLQSSADRLSAYARLSDTEER